jgi:hypothetical protein
MGVTIIITVVFVIIVIGVTRLAKINYYEKNRKLKFDVNRFNQ